MTPNRDTPASPDPREQLVPYVLGELTDVEQERLEQQLARDPELRAELEQIEETSLAMLAATPQLAAPPALKGRVMDAIDGAVAHDAARSAPSTGQPATPQSARFTDRLRSWLAPAPALAGGLAIACAVLAVALVDTRGALSDAKQDVRDARAAGSSGPQMLPVRTTDQLTGARGHLMREGDRFVLVFEDLPSPGQGSWQIWTADRQGTIRNVGMWKGNGRTHAVTIEGAGTIAKVLVSREQTTDRMASPSSAPVASATT